AVLAKREVRQATDPEGLAGKLVAGKLRTGKSSRLGSLFATSRAFLWALLLLLATFNLQLATAATVTGTLQDISLQGLDTKLIFAPTNEVMVGGTGLSAGPPKVIESVNGAFSIVLEAGDYTVSLPLISWRRPF